MKRPRTLTGPCRRSHTVDSPPSKERLMPLSRKSPPARRQRRPSSPRSRGTRFGRAALVLEQLEDRLTPSTLIPVGNHRDLVFDSTRGLLYITTSAGTVQRYDVNA